MKIKNIEEIKNSSCFAYRMWLFAGLRFDYYSRLAEQAECALAEALEREKKVRESDEACWAYNSIEVRYLEDELAKAEFLLNKAETALGAGGELAGVYE